MDLSADELKSRIFARLRDDGREPYSTVAAALGVSRHLVASTVQQALEAGELRITASISPDLLGLERFAYLQLELDGDANPVRNALTAMPETTFVANTSGLRPLDAELRVGPDPHLRTTLDRIKSLPGVRALRMVLYDSIEINLFSPLRTGATTFDLDHADRAIVRLLQRDGRASLRDIAAVAGLSPSGARLRLERLLRSEAVKVVGIPVRRTPSTLTLGAGIRVRGPLAPAIERVRAIEPEFLAVTMGDFDLLATLSANTLDDLVALNDRLRNLEEVESVETWANLRILKEQYGEEDRISATGHTRPAVDH